MTLMWKYLTNQRGQAPFWGSLLQGLGRSLQANKEREFKKQQLKLQQQQIKIQEQNAQLQQDMLKHKLEQAANEAKAREGLATTLEQPTPPMAELAGEQPQLVTPDLKEQSAFRQQVLGAGPKAFQVTPPTQMNRVLAGMVRTGQKIPSQLFANQLTNKPSVVGAGGALVSPTGEVLFQNPSATRTPIGANSRIFAGLVEKHGGDVDAATQEYISIIGQQSAARGAGAIQGQTAVKATPGYQQTERQVARQRAEGATAGKPIEGSAARDISQLQNLLGNTIPNIEGNYDKGFLGPIQGTEMGFEYRRRFGTASGMPVSEQETTFRLALKDASDQLLRARSGAQINEQEYKRLKSILPNATDEPQVFKKGLERFKGELISLVQKKQKLAVTPRGSLPPPPPGWK